MLWMILVGVAVMALVLLEFWPTKPGRADNGVSNINGMDQITRSVERPGPRVPQPRAADAGAAGRLTSRQRR
jgi:hypothetical protein